MKNIKQSRVVESAFLFLAVGSLMLLSLSISKAQSEFRRCEEGYVYEQVKEYVYEPESQTVYNPLTDRYEARYVYRQNYRLVWKCVPNGSNSKTLSSGNSPTDEEALRRAAEDLFNEAQSFQLLGRHREAINKYDAALLLKRNYTEAYFGRGDAKLKLKDYRGALADYDTFLLRYFILEVEDKAKGRGGINFDLVAMKSYAELAYYNRGAAKEMLGDKVGACKDFRKSCAAGNKRACKASKNACNSR